MITPAFAQGAAAATDSYSSLMQFAPFILIFVVMYFLMIRPQQRKAKEHRQMLQAVRRGDVIVTAGGLLAKVTKAVDDQAEVEVEIADGVKVKLVRSMIADVRTRGEPVKNEPVKAAKPTAAEKAKAADAKVKEAAEKAKEAADKAKDA